MSIAKLVSSRTHLIPGRLRVSELFFDVPLDHSLLQSSITIRIFGRSLERVEAPAAPPPADQKPKQLPYFVYLQGGPGFGCALPQDYAFTGLVLDRGFKVRVFLDLSGDIPVCVLAGLDIKSRDFDAFWLEGMFTTRGASRK